MINSLMYAFSSFGGISSGEAVKVVNIPTFREAVPKGGETDTTFFTSEKYCMTNHGPHTIFFTSEKNRMTNQIVSRF